MLQKNFKKYNVKMLNQHQEFSPDALSKYIALKTLEGVSFGVIGHLAISLVRTIIIVLLT